MAQDYALEPPPAPPVPGGRPDQQPAGNADEGVASIDKAYWLDCLADAERAEADWRKRGRDIVAIYRNEAKSQRSNKWTFNILFANTETMLPAIYSKPPEPVVRSRFTSVASPPTTPPMVPPGITPPVVPGMPPAPPPFVGAGGPVPPPELAGVEPSAPPQPPPAPAFPPVAGGPPPGAPIIVPPGGGGVPAPAVAAPPPVMPAMPPAPPPGPPKPAQKDIETAASVMEKALEIVVDDEHSHEAIKMAIKDVLLPGRGVCRVRWKPQMASVPVMAGDGVTPLPPPPQMGDNGGPPMEDVKVWEEVDDEYVYWEDLLVDPVRAVADMNWIAFRHLFTRQELEREFAGSPEYDTLIAQGKLDEIFRWTDESAAKSPPGGGSAIPTADKLGGKIRKAMLWEIWDRMERRIIWLCRDVTGIVFRVDPDVLQLQGFYPIPAPMLAVTTTDSRIPKPYFDLYAKLAADLDETSQRISNLTKQVKVRGAYNSASREIADILTADDNKMIGVEGVDMINGGLSNHIWLVPVVEFMNALDKLFLAREQTKQAIYEVMGISDIMRGATKASETATAQRIKGSMGIVRLEDLKQQTGNFVRDLLRLKAEIIGQNFDAATLSAMTGEDVTPEVLAILRSDFQRTCTIDIEADSTVAVDEQAEQQSMAMVMQSIQLVMQGVQSMLMTQMLPPQQIIQLGLELLKMALHPVRYSRGVVELINDFQEQLMAMAAMPPPPLPVGGPPGMPPPGPQGGPPPEANGVGGLPLPPMGNGAAGPPIVAQ